MVGKRGAEPNRFAGVNLACEPIAVFQIELEEKGSRKRSRHAIKEEVGEPLELVAPKSAIAADPSAATAAASKEGSLKMGRGDVRGAEVCMLHNTSHHQVSP